MKNGKAFSYAGHKIPTLDDVKQMMREKKYLDQLQEKTDDTDGIAKKLRDKIVGLNRNKIVGLNTVNKNDPPKPPALSNN